MPLEIHGVLPEGKAGLCRPFRRGESRHTSLDIENHPLAFPCGVTRNYKDRLTKLIPQTCHNIDERGIYQWIIGEEDQCVDSTRHELHALNYDVRIRAALRRDEIDRISDA